MVCSWLHKCLYITASLVNRLSRLEDAPTNQLSLPCLSLEESLTQAHTHTCSVTFKTTTPVYILEHTHWLTHLKHPTITRGTIQHARSSPSLSFHPFRQGQAFHPHGPELDRGPPSPWDGSLTQTTKRRRLHTPLLPRRP